MPRTIGVIDIGKSNAKFAVVDPGGGTEIDVHRMPNVSRTDGPYPHYDVETLWRFLIDAIGESSRRHPLDALVVTTHGASAALLAEDGTLALPVLDYEFAGPDELASEYDALRPEFAETFTPRLPQGLILGAQLFWQARRFAAAFEQARSIVPYPQYWGFRLTGVAASELTSLGCHTDLWSFESGLFSSLVMNQGWLPKMPEVRPAAAVLGAMRPELAGRLGLRPDLPVHVGIHDSNASLLPHLIGRKPPFSVVSTGTWVIACSPGGELGALDPRRDCLANIDAFGRPVPSARFMGGREFATLTGGRTTTPPDAAIVRVLDTQEMLLPSVQQGSGPFPGRKSSWLPGEPADPDRAAAVSFYLALMTAECLGMTGGEDQIIVEGPFAGNRLYLEMLAASTGRLVLADVTSATGTSIGAALLALKKPSLLLTQPQPVAVPAAMLAPMQRYAARWRAAVSPAG